MKTKTIQSWLAATGLLCAAVSWGAPVPSGAMAEYLVHCDPWALTRSEAACAGFVGRLEDAADPSSRDERLALLLVHRKSLSAEEECAALEAILTDHPDYAEVLYYLSLYDCVAQGESIALLRRAAEAEPDNYRVLVALLTSVEGLFPEAAGISGRVPEVDTGSLAAYREALYEAGKARAVWWQAILTDAEPDDDLPAEAILQATIWEGPMVAGRSIYAAALREGDRRAAEAIQARLQRDLGLDALDYGPQSASASLALACQPSLYDSLGMEDVCLSSVEKLAGQASADGLQLPNYVLKAVGQAADDLRRAACAASQGVIVAERLSVGKCPPEVTETDGVRRLRAVLEHHGGPWSSEHYRVHAQGFLGDEARREGLHTALRADPENAQARCDLAQALSRQYPDAAAAVLGEGGDPSCLEGGPHVWGDLHE